MPIYDYQCPRCLAEQTLVCAVKDHEPTPQCRCGAPMEQILQPALTIIGDIAPYVAVAGDMMGKVIGSRQEHKAFLKRNKMVEVGTDPPKDTSKFRPTVTRKEIREELRRVVPQVLKHARNGRRA